MSRECPGRAFDLAFPVQYMIELGAHDQDDSVACAERVGSLEGLDANPVQEIERLGRVGIRCGFGQRHVVAA